MDKYEKLMKKNNIDSIKGKTSDEEIKELKAISEDVMAALCEIADLIGSGE